MFLVMSHSGGVGPPLPTPQVRAALAVRLNGIARGGSGASPAVADVLAAMLNAGVHPVVPEIGSVGAADIAPMAAMAQVAVGQGPGGVPRRGASRRRGAAAGRDHAAGTRRQGRAGAGLSQRGLHRPRGAGCCSGRAGSRGRGCRRGALDGGDRGQPVDPASRRRRAPKPIPGQAAAADHLRELLAGSELLRARAARVRAGRPLVPGRTAGPRGAARVCRGRPERRRRSS